MPETGRHMTNHWQSDQAIPTRFTRCEVKDLLDQINERILDIERRITIIVERLSRTSKSLAQRDMSRSTGTSEVTLKQLRKEQTPVL